MLKKPYALNPIKNIWGQFANKKYMGADCQNKYGDRLPIQNICGQIATNAKYMGTDCK